VDLYSAYREHTSKALGRGRTTKLLVLLLLLRLKGWVSYTFSGV